MENSTSSHEWRKWLDEYASRLLLFARQQSRNAADAEDLLQEAMVEVWNRVNHHELPPLALVYTTIRRRAIDQARREDRRRKREEASAGTDGLWFDTGLMDNETCKLVETGMKALPEIYGEVVTLKIWGELTFDEIAGVLDIPANTAASRYRYGLEALRKNLKDVIL
ncbi:MAG: RNA polymerase sigma factor [Verrucomicrobia bacterium]|nr:RNA polymerase sigma factor [Verrucomicrobiota bacterium]MBU4290800.1 RNA polymerase sigma factor [Verrucomicrobiota bacterium]MBU4430392.1 RNA polymerase sigma factor [Verrucomicrobiota bacterium]MCG2681247.1 RNA polymerase sigma factor [Kiritimatiellia bacterium]